MSCIITYKGKQYSKEKFKEYFINNKNEFATSISKNRDVIDSFKRKMEAIDGVFKDSPELASIGTKAQYMQYLSTIFKTSQVKDIVYRSGAMSPKEYSESMTDYMDLGVGYYLSPLKTFSEEYGTPKAVIVNIKTPKDATTAYKERVEYGQSGNYGVPKLDDNGKYDGIVDLSKNLKDTYELVVFKPEQIHILGNKQDIERFKKFVNKDEIKTTEQSNTNISLLNEDIGIKLDINTPEGAAFINAINNGDIESTNCK
jgi:hypothetical protein